MLHLNFCVVYYLPKTNQVVFSGTHLLQITTSRFPTVDLLSQCLEMKEAMCTYLSSPHDTYPPNSMQQNKGSKKKKINNIIFLLLCTTRLLLSKPYLKLHQRLIISHFSFLQIKAFFIIYSNASST